MVHCRGQEIPTDEHNLQIAGKAACRVGRWGCTSSRRVMTLAPVNTMLWL